MWKGGLRLECEEGEDTDECPEEESMTVRQTSLVISEGEVFDEERVDVDLNTDCNNNFTK